MNFYLLILFFHIVGAVGIFMGLGMEGIILSAFNRVSTAEQALSWGTPMKLLRIAFSSSSIY